MIAPPADRGHAVRARPVRRRPPARPRFGAAVDRLDSPGQPLEPAVRAAAERALGHDLGDVRIHDDAQAAAAAEALGAAAFVLGRHVYFAPGRYSLGIPAGRRLLLHELAHVVQLGAATTADPAVTVCRESEADRLADTPAVETPAPFPAPPPSPHRPDPAPRGGAVLPALHFRDAAPPPTTVRVVDLLVRLVGRTLRMDPDDRAGRVGAQLARLDAGLRAAVLERARTVLSPLEVGRLETVVARTVPGEAVLSTPVAPGETTQADATATATSAPGAVPAETAATAAPATEAAPAGTVTTEAAGTTPAGTAPTEPAAAPAEATDTAAAPSGPVPEPVKADAGSPAPVPAATGTGTEATAEGDGAGVAAAREDTTIAQPDAGRAVVAAGAAGSAPGASAEAAVEPDAAPAREQDDDAAVLDAAGQGPATTEGASGPEEQAESAGDDVAGAADAATGPAGAGEDGGAPASDDAPAAGSAADASAGASTDADASATEPAGADGATAGAGAHSAGVDAASPATPQPDAGPANPELEPASLAPAPGSTTAEPAGTAATDVDAAEPGTTEPGAAELGAGEPDAVDVPAEAPGTGGPGGCGPSADATAPPAVEPDTGGACATSGGSTPAPAPPPPAPDVANLPPGEALAIAAAGRPTALAAALPQVGAAASGAVTAQRTENAASPPELPRPSGAAAMLDVTAPVPAVGDPGYSGPSKVDRIGATGGPPAAPPPPAPVPDPAAASPTAAVPQTRLPGDAPLSAADVTQVSRTVAALPARDPELDVNVGPTPRVELMGDADPGQVAAQRAALDRRAQEAATQGAADAATPLGEADIRPHVPEQTLRAAPPAEGATCPGLPARRPPEPAKADRSAVAVDAIAGEQSGEQIRAATAPAGTDVADARAAHDERASKERTDARTQMEEQVVGSAREQVAVRETAVADSAALRTSWTEEQRGAMRTADSDGTTAVEKADRDVGEARRQGEEKAKGHVDTGNAEIARSRATAETTARAEQEKARKEESSGGLLGWIGSQISAFLDGIKAAISAAFELARKAVRAAIDTATRLARAAIDVARRAIVGLIAAAGTALLAVGDVLLAAFPEARKKFRGLVREQVQRAVDAVNAAADALRQAVQKALDLLAAALDCALQYLEAGYLAAVDAVGAVVTGALAAARKFLDTLAEWADIVSDVAADPVGWLKNMGTAAVDGVRNCLWSALKRAVKEWFHSKVEEVVGVGRAIIDVLIRGCLKFADIARMVWDGIKAALPGILIQLIIEKLIALLVPAGAALSLIIDGLRAAWGAASRILAAFAKFMAFLKAVKTGRAAGDFAELVAAAGVAVLDFLSNFLIGKLKGAATGVGSALKAMAGRIGRGLARAGRAVAGGVRSGLGGVRRARAAVGRATRRGAARVGRALDPRRLARAVARSQLGQAVGRASAGVRAAVSKQRDRFRQWRERRRERARERRRERERQREERRRRAPEETRKRLADLLSRGVGRLRMGLELLRLKVAYHWRRLRLIRHPGSTGFVIRGRINPEIEVAEGFVIITAGPMTVRVGGAPDTKVTGGQYEQAVRREFVGPYLEAETGMKSRRTYPWDRPRAPSTLTLLSIDEQRKQVRAGESTGVGAFVPEWIAREETQDPTSRRRKKGVPRIHAVEATTAFDWKHTVRREPNKHEEVAAHKTDQHYRALLGLLEDPANRRSPIIYTIVCPEGPSEWTKSYITKLLDLLDTNQRRRLQVRWVIVPWRR